jgi:hypothetical protein
MANRRIFATDSNIPESFRNYWNETGIAQFAKPRDQNQDMAAQPDPLVPIPPPIRPQNGRLVTNSAGTPRLRNGILKFSAVRNIVGA